MRDTKGAAPGTIRAYLLDIDRVVKYLVETKGLHTGDMDAYTIISKKLKSELRKLENKRIVQRIASTSVRELVRTGKCPESGIKGMQEAVLRVANSTTWLRRLRNWMEYHQETYLNSFYELFFAAMYVFHPQGRVGGIHNMTIQNADDILRDELTMARNFKTSAIFVVQPVPASDPLIKRLLTCYMKQIRPRISGVPEPNLNATLFLTYDGILAMYINYYEFLYP